MLRWAEFLFIIHDQIKIFASRGHLKRPQYWVSQTASVPVVLIPSTQGWDGQSTTNIHKSSSIQINWARFPSCTVNIWTNMAAGVNIPWQIGMFGQAVFNLVTCHYVFVLYLRWDFIRPTVTRNKRRVDSVTTSWLLLICVHTSSTGCTNVKTQQTEDELWDKSCVFSNSRSVMKEKKQIAWQEERTQLARRSVKF